MIYLLRHAETQESLKGLILGHLDGSLSQRGIEQALNLKQTLSSLNYSVIYSSDLNRCVQTLKYASVPLEKVNFDPSFRERDYGFLNGKLVSDVNFSLGGLNSENQPAKGESLIFFRNRILSAYERFLTKENSLVCTHAGFIINLMSILEGVDIHTYIKKNGIPEPAQLLEVNNV